MKLLKPAVIAARLLLGATFLVSGLAKLIDLYGTVFKFEDYFAAWGLVGAIPEGLTLMAAGGLSLLEFLVGFMLATGSMRRTAALLATAVMAFMLPFSLYIMLANPVDDCGCFGDLFIISNRATFWKNILLTALAIFLLRYNRRARCLFPPWVQWMSLAVAAAFGVTVASIGWLIQPLLDFRPYKLGTEILADGDLDDTLYIYRGPDGELHSFDPYSLPDEVDGWEFVDVESNSAAASSQFAIFDPTDGSDVTSAVITTEGPQLLLVIPRTDAATVAASYVANELSAAMEGNFLAITGGSQADIDRWRDLSMASYPIYTADERMLKTLVRGSMALVMIQDGFIVWKRTLLSVDAQSIAASPQWLVANLNPWCLLRFYILALIFIGLEATICLLGYIPRQIRTKKRSKSHFSAQKLH